MPVRRLHRLPPRPYLFPIRFAAGRHARQWRIGNLEQELFDLLLARAQPSVVLGYLTRDLLHLAHQLRGVFARLLQLADPLGRRVPPCLELLDDLDDPAALLVQRHDLVNRSG